MSASLSPSRRAARFVRVVAAFVVGVVTLLPFLPSVAHPAETTLTKATDLQADAAAARKAGVPILVLYSLPGCPYCEAIRRSHLTPLVAEKPVRAIIRQIDLQSSAALRDFDGKPTTHADFVRARGIKFAPVVSFFGADGKTIGEPLMGTMLPDFYGAYLADALSAATAKVRAGGHAKAHANAPAKAPANAPANARPPP
ncbi:MAG: thioredoxin [Aeromicrobium sp.]|nr:thioredoxin [Burkholderiales bacterium]